MSELNSGQHIPPTRRGRGIRLTLSIVALLVIGAVAWHSWADGGGRGSANSGGRSNGDALARHFNLDGLLLRGQNMLSGGPPKDGIPALTDPVAAPVGRAQFMKRDHRVVGVTLGGESRAYPINVLNWHEIINDQLGGVPIAVIYCPLCDSVSVVDRRMGGKTLEFGVSGLLYNSNVLMYDRVDQALWSQVRLTAVSGPHAGESLGHLPFELTTFGAWRDAHPGGSVVTFETGHQRDYQRNPYGGYFAHDGLQFPVARRDRRLRNKVPVIGVKLGDVARAYPVATIQQTDARQITDTLAGATVTLRADERGVAVIEAPSQAQVVHTFWFAWSAFHPQTELYGRLTDPQQGARP